MPILADTIDGVIGVDTLAAAICTPVGRVTTQTTTSADAAGYHVLLDLARTQVPGRRCWAVEGTGSYGAGLASFLRHQGEQVIEVGRPKRPALRGVGKSDPIDAVRAANDALTLPRPTLPRGRGHREALRVLLVTRHGAVAARKDAINQLKALIVGAPDELRAQLRGHSTAGQITHCARLRHRPTTSLEDGMTVRAMQVTARCIQALQAEADALHAELAALVAAVAPWLPELPAIGPISAAQILVNWSYAGRRRQEPAGDPTLLQTQHRAPTVQAPRTLRPAWRRDPGSVGEASGAGPGAPIIPQVASHIGRGTPTVPDMCVSGGC
jgi:transposase